MSYSMTRYFVVMLMLCILYYETCDSEPTSHSPKILQKKYKTRSADASITAASGKPPSRKWQTIVRQKGFEADALLATNEATAAANTTCQQLFNAEAWRDDSGDESAEILGACVCAKDAPIFRHDSSQCVRRLDECRNPIAFKNVDNHSKSNVYTTTLPTDLRHTTLIEDRFVVLWKENSIKVKARTGARCNVSNFNFLASDSKWYAGDPGWLKLGWSNKTNAADIQWNLASVNSEQLESVRQLLSGSIALADLECQAGGSLTKKRCFVLRIAGEIVNSDIPQHSDEGNKSIVLHNDTTSGLFVVERNRPLLPSGTTALNGRAETILIILLAILLFLSIIGSIILWNICWRIKKSELISTLQMQFLYHIKHEKEKATVVDAQSRYRALAAAKAVAAAAAAGQDRVYSSGSGGSFSMTQQPYGNSSATPYFIADENGEEVMTMEAMEQMCSMGSDSGSIGGTTDGIVATKRKLYFSSEFFDPYFMMNPPPMADQFLNDLRKMIGIAKQRIALRKHVPQLPIIMEEGDKELREFDWLKNDGINTLSPSETEWIDRKTEAAKGTQQFKGNSPYQLRYNNEPMTSTTPIRRQSASQISEEAATKPSPIRISEEKIPDTTTLSSLQKHRLFAASPSPPILRSGEGESSPKSSNSCGGEDDSGRDSLPDGSGSDSSSGECSGADGNVSPAQSPSQPIKPSNSFQQTPKKRANNSGAIRQLASVFELNSNSSQFNNNNAQELSFITDPPPLPIHRRHYPESSVVDQISPPTLKDQPLLMASPSTSQNQARTISPHRLFAGMSISSPPSIGVITSTNGSSRIPISKSPKLQSKMHSLMSLAPTIPAVKTTGGTNTFSSPTGNTRSKCLTGTQAPRKFLPPPPPPPPLPSTNPPSTPPASVLQRSSPSALKQHQPASHAPMTMNAMKRSSYAVFPSDHMLKKSLPRRIKKTANTNTAAEI